MADQGQGQKIKEKIKHIFHHDKKNVTTPDASPGNAGVGTHQSNTTTNVPEAFYPGAAPVVPEETHSTRPYSSALGNNQIPPGDLPTSAPVGQRNLPTSGPADSAAMLGAPPPSITKPKDTPVSDNREVNPSSQTPGTESGDTAYINPSGETPGTESGDTADINPTGETPGTESDVQTKDTESGVKIVDLPDKESTAQTEDYPVTDSVVESKDPGTDSDVGNAGVGTLNQDDTKFAQENA